MAKSAIREDLLPLYQEHGRQTSELFRALQNSAVNDVAHGATTKPFVDFAEFAHAVKHQPLISPEAMSKVADGISATAGLDQGSAFKGMTWRIRNYYRTDEGLAFSYSCYSSDPSMVAAAQKGASGDAWTSELCKDHLTGKTVARFIALAMAPEPGQEHVKPAVLASDLAREHAFAQPAWIQSVLVGDPISPEAAAKIPFSTAASDQIKRLERSPVISLEESRLIDALKNQSDAAATVARATNEVANTAIAKAAQELGVQHGDRVRNRNGYEDTVHLGFDGQRVTVRLGSPSGPDVEDAVRKGRWTRVPEPQHATATP